MRVALHSRKKQLISLMQKVGIGIVEKCSLGNPGNRKWSLSFNRLGGESPSWFIGKKDGIFREITKMKIYGRTLDDLYDRALLSALKTSMHKVAWNRSVSMEPKNADGSLVGVTCSMLEEKKLLSSGISECHSLAEAILRSAIEEGE